MARRVVRIEDVTLKRSTEKAGLFIIDDGDDGTIELWLPWSQVLEGSVDRDGETGDLIIPLWLAEKHELEFSEEEEE